MGFPFPDNTVFSRIEKGESPTAVLLDTLPGDKRMSLARCALVRQFDSKLFDQHLRAGDVRLGDLVREGWVERSAWTNRPGGIERYRLADYLRDDATKLWWPDDGQPPIAPPAELKELSGRIAAYCAEAGWPIEQLRQLAIASPEEAEEQFGELYQAADADFDLAHCQDAIDALSEPDRGRLLPHALRETVAEYQRRTIARSLRAVEFYQTRDITYQPRERVHGEFLRLLSSEPGAPWLLQLHGNGGTGKTTLLHWFISRVCVRRRPIVACARINCDTLDPAVVLDQPWLLLLDVAEQLNRQLPGAPFLELNRAFADYRDRLRRSWHSLEGESDPQQAKLLGEEAERRFCSSVPASGPPILLALDGLDQICNRSRAMPGLLDRLISMLLRVHAKVGTLRVVLAGRDDLSALLPERLTVEAGAVGVSNVPIPRFDEDETAAYFVRRKVPDDGRVAVVHRKSEAIPMVIALYADLISQEPELTAADIERKINPLVEYLIQRIIGRIPDPIVGNALLYSVVVPAALDFAFFRDVMLPLWRAQAAGPGILRELDPDRTVAHPPVPAVDDELGQRLLWKEIVEQAAKATWISVESVGGGEAVKVHSDVRAPLRAAIREHKTFALLHKRAADYHRERADASQTGAKILPEWLPHTRLAIYHHLQRRDPDAIAEWREAVRRAWSARRSDWVRSLAEYIRHEDFQGADGKPDRVVLTGQLLYEASIELALVAARDAGRLPGLRGAGADMWQPDAARNLAEAGAADNETSSDYEVIIAALLAVEDKDWGRALERLDAVTSTAGPTLGDAWLVRARALAGRFGYTPFPDEPTGAIESYHTACDHHEDPESIVYACLDAARWLLSIDRPDLALAWCDQAERAGPGIAPADETPADFRARALLALGRPGSALHAIEEPAWRAATACSRQLAARAQLALGRPSLALDELAEAPPDPDGESAEPDDNCAGIDHDLLLARVHGELLDIDQAEYYFNHAQQRLRGLEAEAEHQARINTARAVFELRITGNLMKAGVYLSASEAVPPGKPAWTALQLARAELADRLGHAEEVVSLLREAREHRSADAPVSSLIRVLVTGLAASSVKNPAIRREFLRTLTGDLARIVPAARLPLLAGLLCCRPVAKAAKLAEGLRVLTDHGAPDSGAEPSPETRLDKAWHDLAMAQVFRFTEEPAAAERSHAAATLTLREDPFVRWQIAIAQPNSADAQPTPAVLPDPYQFRARYGNYPVLFAAFMVTWAARHDPGYRSEEVYRLLQEAGRLLQVSPVRRQTVWHLRLYQALIGAEEKRTGKAPTELTEIVAEIRAELGERPSKGTIEMSAGFWKNRPAVAELRLSDGERGRVVSLSSRRPEELAASSESALDFAEVKLDTDTLPLKWGQQAGERLGARMAPLLADSGSDAADVRLSFRRPNLAADPWELTVVDDVQLAAHPSVRFIFRDADHTLSARHVRRYLERANQARDPGGATTGKAPSTGSPTAALQAIRTALRERAALQDGRRLRICVIQPMVGGDLYTLRGLGERLEKLEAAYRTAFRGSKPAPDLQVVYGDKVADLYAGAPEAADTADVLHVCTVMRATAQMPVLGLDAGRQGPPLTAPELDLLIQRLTGTIPPLVVLDVQMPPGPGPGETSLQLGMRNRFAQQLLEMGSVNTIIATGLASDYDSAQWEILTRGLAGSQNAAEICRAIQRYGKILVGPSTAGQQDVRAAAFAATALFTTIHADALIEPGLIRVPETGATVRSGK